MSKVISFIVEAITNRASKGMCCVCKSSVYQQRSRYQPYTALPTDWRSYHTYELLRYHLYLLVTENINKKEIELISKIPGYW